jgi:hypothetical protein
MTDIIPLDYKVGTKFTGEDLNTEFKKFTIIDRKLNKSDKIILDDFFSTGIIDDEVNNFFIETIKKYIAYYVPKYTGCFFNSDNIFNNSESFFYIGVDDNGTFSGIPHNYTLTDYGELLNIINSSIDLSIRNNVITNNISYEQLNNCIEAKILILNKNENQSQIIKSQSHRNKKNELKNEIESLNKEIEFETIKKTEMDLLFSSLATDQFKTNRIIPEKIIDLLIQQSNFPITNYDKKKHYDYIYNCMTTFDTKLYVSDYETTMEKRTFEEYRDSTRYTLELSTYIHEYIKNMLGRLRDRLKIFNENSARKIKELKDLYNRNIAHYENLYYDFSTYYDLVEQHRENNFIIIKIKFNLYKYNATLKSVYGNIDKNINLLSYREKNKKGETIITSSKRTLKYLKDKLDPECQKI